MVAVCAALRDGLKKSILYHSLELTVTRSDNAANLYFEIATEVTLLILACRYFEKRSKWRAEAALRVLLELGAKDVALLRDGSEIRFPID